MVMVLQLLMLIESMSSLKKVEGEVKLKSEQIGALRIDPTMKGMKPLKYHWDLPMYLKQNNVTSPKIYIEFIKLVGKCVC